MKYPRLKGANMYSFGCCSRIRNGTHNLWNTIVKRSRYVYFWVAVHEFVTVLTIYEIPSFKRSRYVHFWVAIHEFVTVLTIYEIPSSKRSRFVYFWVTVHEGCGALWIKKKTYERFMVGTLKHALFDGTFGSVRKWSNSKWTAKSCFSPKSEQDF